MKNLIFNAFACKETLLLDKKMRNYYECIIVSLCSAKIQSPKDDVALITNVAVPEEYKQLLDEKGIKVILAPFNAFVFETTMNWALAFYKLCAIKYAVTQLQYDNYMLVDTDTFFQRNLEDIWEDAKDNILLYVTGHGINHPQVQGMRECYKQIYGKNISLIHYGGEFIAANQRMLKEFIFQCEVIYHDMLESNVRTTQGDEFITSIVATKERTNIKPANAYIYRYWTGKPHLVSTNYKYDPVSILHLPSEKDCQFPILYRFYKNKKRFPKTIHWLTCMPSTRRSPQYFVLKVISRLFF